MEYLPDVQGLIDLGEYNYERILSLFPGVRTSNRCTVQLSDCLFSKPIRQLVVFQVTSRARYTTCLEVSFKNKSWPAGCSPEPLLVRLYHDARVAEVVHGSPKQIMPGRYRYPNKSMYHADEKAQSNIFLGEWLAYCERFSIIETENADMAGDI